MSSTFLTSFSRLSFFIFRSHKIKTNTHLLKKNGLNTIFINPVIYFDNRYQSDRNPQSPGNLEEDS